MAEELRAALPAAVTAQLDLQSLKPVPAHFADAQLQGSESDLLFSARVAGQRALVYVLIEHQSRPDRFMPLRLLRYIARILDAYRREHPRARRLPAVIPLVLCHDRRPWPYPLELGALYDLPENARQALAPFLPDFRFILDDLAAVDVTQLSARSVSPLVAVALFALKRARHAADLLPELLVITRQFAALEHSPAPDEQIAALLAYIWRVGQIDPRVLLEFTETHGGPKLESIMKTAAERLLDEREAKGEAQGQAKALLRLMLRKFGSVPPAVEASVGCASAEQLERWIERVLFADSAQDVVRD
jgi:hypothetical protein